MYLANKPLGIVHWHPENWWFYVGKLQNFEPQMAISVSQTFRSTSNTKDASKYKQSLALRPKNFELKRI